MDLGRRRWEWTVGKWPQNKTHLHQSAVVHREAQCVSDNLALHDAVSNDVCGRRHLARQGNGKRFLFAVHHKSTAEQNSSTGRNLRQPTTPCTTSVSAAAVCRVNVDKSASVGFLPPLVPKQNHWGQVTLTRVFTVQVPFYYPTNSVKADPENGVDVVWSRSLKFNSERCSRCHNSANFQRHFKIFRYRGLTIKTEHKNDCFLSHCLTLLKISWKSTQYILSNHA